MREVPDPVIADALTRLEFPNRDQLETSSGDILAIR
jgi:hypothetical protein